MKALIKSGVCLALGWLASGASAQDVTIRWQPAKTDGSGRPVTLNQPQPIDATGPVRPVSGPFAPIVRMQAPDEKVVPPVPTLEIGEDGKKEVKPLPKSKDFTPPPPKSMSSPVFSSVMPDGCVPDRCDPCGRDRCDPCGRDRCRSWFHPQWLRGCDDCPRFYAGAELLMWWQRGQVTPPLIVSNPAGTPTAQTGLLTTNSTSVLYDNVPMQTHWGGRFTVGGWSPHFCCNLGLEATYFVLARSSGTSVFSSNGDPQLSRPFTDTVVGQNAEPFSIRNGTDVASGTATIHDFSQLWGAEANLRYKWLRGPTCRLDLLVGFRHLDLTEGLDITEDRQNVIVGTLPSGIHTFEQESFHTRNQFNGIQIGFDSEYRFWNRWTLGVNGKVAFGNVYQTIDINGTTTFTNVPAPFIAGPVPGALLAGPTNSGHFTRSHFSVAPEVAFKVGYDVTDHLTLFVGYDFLYMSNVVRPGDQIDPRVNQSFRPLPAPFVPVGAGPRLPAVLFRTTDYWAQGLNFGLLYRF